MTHSDTATVMAPFINLFYHQRAVRAAFERWVSPTYVQHNPGSPDGHDAAILALEGFVAAVPGLTFDVKRTLIDGDMAAVHLHVRMNRDDPGLAAVDLFRIADGLIVEHWDVVQPVPAEACNDNTMF